MITTYKIEQTSPEWHELRNGLVTASNAYLLLTKGRNAAANNGQKSGSGYWANRGRTLESEAIEIYQHTFDLPVTY